MTALSTAILKLISDAPGRLAVDTVIQTLSGAGGFRPRELRRAIRELVESGELSYSYELGNSFLAPSFNRPVAVSERITLAPPGHTVQPGPSGVMVTLAPGAAFGYGQHPTTRMALKAVDAALKKEPGLIDDPADGALDIGTGSGVLVIAAVLLGLSGGRGLDIDPCALSEAARNVTLNGLQEKIAIENLPLESLAGRYALVTANLRRPTLEAFSIPIARCVRTGGGLVLSGIKSEEQSGLVETYGALGLKVLRDWDEKEWAAVLMRKEVR